MSVEERTPWDLPETFLFAGQSVRYGMLGRPDHPPLVLVHGTPFSSAVRRRIAPCLAEHRQGGLVLRSQLEVDRPLSA